MPQRASPTFAPTLRIAATAAALLAWPAAPAGAQAVRSATAPAHAAIVDPAELKGLAQVAPTRTGLARAQLQVTIRAEPVPGDPPTAARRELIVVFD